MRVAILVVEHRTALNGLGGDVARDVDLRLVRAVRRFGAGLRGLHSQFQRVEHTARIAVGYAHQVIERVLIEHDRQRAVAAFGIGQGLARHGAQVVLAQAAQLEDAAAADQRLVDLEIGIFSGRADQDDGAVLHPGQERVLLRLVEAVDFIHKEDRLLAVQPAALLRHRHGVADVLDPGQHGVDGDEMGGRGVGDDARQGGLAAAGRPPEDDRRQLVGLNRAAQQTARPNDVFLADELVQRARAHARGQRRLVSGRLLAAQIEQGGAGG